MLDELGFADAEIHSAVSGTQSKIFQDLPPKITAKSVEALTKAIRKAYTLAMVAGVLALLGSFIVDEAGMAFWTEDSCG